MSAHLLWFGPGFELLTDPTGSAVTSRESTYFLETTMGRFVRFAIVILVSVAVCGDAWSQTRPGGQNSKGNKANQGDTTKPPTLPDTNITPLPDRPDEIPEKPDTELEKMLGREPDPMTRTLWQNWWSRNLEAYVEPVTFRTDPSRTIPSYLLDPQWRKQRRDEMRNTVLHTLLPFLDSDSERIRGAAALSLGQLGVDEEQTELLLRAMNDHNAMVRDRALLGATVTSSTPAAYHALGLAAGNPQAFGRLNNQADRNRTRAVAALFLGLAQDMELLPWIRDAALDRKLSQRIRSLFIKALGITGTADALPLLSQIAADREQPSLIRASAVEAMGRIGDPATAEFIVRFLDQRDPETDVRIAAALAAGHVVSSADREAVRSLQNALDREANQVVRGFLLVSFGRIGGATSELVLMDRFQNKRGDERQMAAIGLGLMVRHWNSTSALEALLRSYQRSRSLEDRSSMLAALGLTRRAEALEPLQEAALNGDAPQVRRVAIQAMKALGQGPAILTLQKILKTEGVPEVFYEAAHSLGQLDPVATQQFVAYLARTHSSTTAFRTPVVRSIGFTRDPTALPVLLDFVKTGARSLEEQEAALLAIGKIYDDRPCPVTAPLGYDSNFLRESPEISGLLSLLR